MGEQSFATIIGLLERKNVRHLLEYGSGASTIRFALALSQLRVVSIEHDRLYARETVRLANTYGVETRVNVVDARITMMKIWPWRFITYDAAFGGTADAAVIDGPPERYTGGREYCLYAAFRHLRPGGIIILDDFNRRSERQAVERLLKAATGIHLMETYSSDHGIAVLLKSQADNNLHFGSSWHLSIAADRAARRLGKIKIMLRTYASCERGTS